MIKVLEEKPAPRATIVCNNCGSLLEYGNADLHNDYHADLNCTGYTHKAKNNYILFVHCAIWAFGLSIVLMPLGLFTWWKVVMLLIGHIIIDYWKCRGLYKKWNIKDWTSLYIDQALHVVQVLLCLI